MRLVICDGIQYDAEKLPRGVDASRCMAADEWFAKNRKIKPAPAVDEPEPAVEPDQAAVDEPEPAVEPDQAAVDEPEPKTTRTKRSRG